MYKDDNCKGLVAKSKKIGVNCEMEIVKQIAL